MAIELNAFESERKLHVLDICKGNLETVKRTYSKVKDVALVFEIKTRVHSTKQGTMTVIEYYNALNTLWLELDY